MTLIDTEVKPKDGTGMVSGFYSKMLGLECIPKKHVEVLQFTYLHRNLNCCNDELGEGPMHLGPFHVVFKTISFDALFSFHFCLGTGFN